jgi:hypothetical protein
VTGLQRPDWQLYASPSDSQSTFVLHVTKCVSPLGRVDDAQPPPSAGTSSAMDARSDRALLDIV